MTAANDTTPLPCFGFTAETWRDRSNAARKPWGIFLGDILVSVDETQTEALATARGYLDIGAECVRVVRISTGRAAGFEVRS